MPIVTIQITREGTTPEQKAALIKGVTNAVPSCAAAAPSASAATTPAPSMILPAAITGTSKFLTKSRVSAIVPSRSSGASGSNTPRCPPAS